MIRRCIAIALTCLTFGPMAQAEEDIVLGLNQTEVSIATNFNGSEIIIFGAVKRETPIPDTSQLQVVVTVSGPSKPVVVRRKEKKFGIWVNTASVEVDRAPSFYAVATSGPLRDVLSRVEDLRYKISIPRAIRSVGAPMTIMDSAAFTEALIRIRSKENQYQLDEAGVTVDQQTLFRATVQLPAALVEGDYDTRIFLTRDGNVVAQYETLIDVYGLLSLAIAITAGWLASAAFALIRR
jgi:uncharacterized protein (TIGR02186 family)